MFKIFLNEIFYPNNMYKNEIQDNNEKIWSSFSIIVHVCQKFDSLASGLHRDDPTALKLTFYNSRSENFVGVGWIGENLCGAIFFLHNKIVPNKNFLKILIRFSSD